MLCKREGDLNSWNGYHKVYIEIYWITDNVQARIFVAGYEGRININENLLNNLFHASEGSRTWFKKLICNGYPSLS